MSSFDTMPMLRIELRGHVHTLIQTLKDHHEEIEKYAEQALDEALKENSLRDLVYAETRRIIPSLIKSAVERAYQDISYSPEFKEAISVPLRVALLEVLGGQKGVDPK